MKTTSRLFAASVLALAACQDTPGASAPAEPESAGSAGPGFCETVPSDPSEMERWNELCFPDGDR
jgi:hypothetical protein